MKNCMSQTSENSVTEDSEAKCIEEKSVEGKNENLVTEEKMQIDTPERRQSVNSEANNDGRDITPIQTDNDEVSKIYYFFLNIFHFCLMDISDC